MRIRGPERAPQLSGEAWDKVSKLRSEYMSCVKLAHETDSKKEEAYLKADAKKSLEELQATCPHQHIVCLQSASRGSYSMDYDDRYPEKRVCLCCGITEAAWTGEHFKVLIYMPFARFEDNGPEQIKNPLSYLLTDACEIAETKGYAYFGWNA